MDNPYLLDTPAVVSFSGGRTSGYMLYHILQAFGGRLPDDVKVIFCNTGKERPETLDFVERCSQEWGVPVTWLEYDSVTKEGERQKTRNGRLERPYQPFAREVNYATASRNGEPFEKIIRDRGMLPNPIARFCTVEGKILTTVRYLESLGWGQWDNAIGFRADEPQRVAKLERANRRHAGETPVYPLFHAGATRDNVMRFWNAHPFDLQLEQDEGNCDACLAGETEVVTSQGIKQIKDLVGTEPELLVPKISNGSLSEVGKFQKCPVRSFGVQRLWKITLAGHGRSVKEVYATSDHRWFLVGKPGNPSLSKDQVTTAGLKVGDRLKNLHRCQVGENRGGVSKMGAMHGFVWGDGSTPHGDRPALIHIHEGKDEVFRPMFEACCNHRTVSQKPTGSKYWTYYGIPRAWKTAYPDLNESRHYLLGWLSGWFAADGCVDEFGACILNAAKREHLQFARSVCAILGIQCSGIREYQQRVRLPQGDMIDRTLCAISLNRNQLPLEFFWIEHHRQRAELASPKQVRRYGWTVKSVEQTERVEEVYCATVPEVGAFGLADGLMTGNCFLKGAGKIRRIFRNRPDLADWWIKMESIIEGGRSGTDRFRNDRPPYRVQLQMALQPSLLDDGADPADELSIACHCTD